MDNTDRPGYSFLSFCSDETITGNLLIQIPCNTPYTPPDNCLQYYTGITGTVQSFNFQTGGARHLADQNQRICIRPERGRCSITYAVAAINGAISVSGTIAATAIEGAL